MIALRKKPEVLLRVTLDKMLPNPMQDVHDVRTLCPSSHQHVDGVAQDLELSHSVLHGGVEGVFAGHMLDLEQTTIVPMNLQLPEKMDTCR